MDAHRVLVLVDQVFRHILLHKQIRLLWHPGVYKAGKVQQRRAVERELIVDDLVRRRRVDALGRQTKLGDSASPVPASICVLLLRRIALSQTVRVLVGFMVLVAQSDEDVDES